MATKNPTSKRTSTLFRSTLESTLCNTVPQSFSHLRRAIAIWMSPTSTCCIDFTAMTCHSKLKWLSEKIYSSRVVSIHRISLTSWSRAQPSWVLQESPYSTKRSSQSRKPRLEATFWNNRITWSSVKTGTNYFMRRTSRKDSPFQINYLRRSKRL